MERFPVSCAISKSASHLSRTSHQFSQISAYANTSSWLYWPFPIGKYESAWTHVTVSVWVWVVVVGTIWVVVVVVVVGTYTVEVTVLLHDAAHAKQ